MPIFAASAALVLLAAGQPAAPQLGAADRAAAFAAAGFKRHGAEWRKCDDPGSPSYVSGRIESTADLNHDGLPEAVISEDSTACYGEAGSHFVLVGKQRGGAWKLLFEADGMVTFLPGRGAAGWPDLEIGGPGFCFPHYRWNGKAWRPAGYGYEGKTCRL